MTQQVHGNFVAVSKGPALRSLLREYGLAALMLLVSFFTTTANGARFMLNFQRGWPPVAHPADFWPWLWLAHHRHAFLSGLPFSLTVLGILLTHEFGHYFACRAHRIFCTPPFVIPAPTMSGTFGAVIRIRSFVPNRNALMDVGIFGPLAGYIASFIAIIVGFLLSKASTPNAPQSLIDFSSNTLTFRVAETIAAHGNRALLHSGQPLAWHPILLAGWIGLFITALNLLPGGQLDGGHILYAISPRVHRAVTWVLPFVLFAMGVFYWAGWILWGIILLIPIFRHPRIPIDTELSPARIALGAVGLALLALTFTPAPFADTSLLDFWR